MKDYVFEIASALKGYRFAERSLLVVGCESLLVAFIIGIVKEDIGWGIGGYIFLMLLYGFPVAGGVLAFIFSLVESIVVYYILFHFTSTTWSWFIAIVAFVILVSMHQVYGNIEDNTKGYALVIFDSLVICGCTYMMSQNIIISVIIFTGMMVVMFVPILRVVQSVILSLGTSGIMYWFASDSLDRLYAVLVALFTLIYTGTLYAFAYLSIDYKGLFRTKKQQKYIEEQNEKMNVIREGLYHQFPELEKKHYFFYTEVCQTEQERAQFEYDWDRYLIYLNVSGEKITFNQYFDKEKLYKSSKYNRDFAKKNADNDEFGDDGPSPEVNQEADKSIIYFTGVNNVESLKKRYRDLLKIYHPDNQNGDVTISQKIQEEYEFLLNKFGAER